MSILRNSLALLTNEQTDKLTITARSSFEQYMTPNLFFKTKDKV